MKKITLFSLILILPLILSGCFLEDACFFYSDSVTIDGFEIYENSVVSCCFAGAYNCTKYGENIEITLPDDYNNVPIKRLGGYVGKGVPTPFIVSLSELYMNTPQGSVFHGDIEKLNIKEPYTVKDIVVNLNIGKNIEVIEHVEAGGYYPHLNDDGSTTYYRAVYKINCSDENEYFYSKEGKLYTKKDNSLVTDFVYVTE